MTKRNIMAIATILSIGATLVLNFKNFKDPLTLLAVSGLILSTLMTNTNLFERAF